MASRVLVTGLPRSLPPLPPGPAPTCVPCIKGQQRAAPHSFEFPPTEAPLQTLHIDVWGPARVRGQDHERYFLLVVDDYSRYTIVFPLRRKGEVTEVLIDWIRAARRQLSESFGSDLPVLRQHSDRGREFCSDLLRAFCRAEGICQTFTLPASLQQNGIAERHIGMVMDVARTFMIHAAALHFLWPFAGPAPSGVSQVDAVEPVEVAVDSSAARGVEPTGARSRGAEPERAEPGGAESGGAEPGVAEAGSAEPEGAELARVESGGAAPGGPSGASSRRAAGAGGATGAGGSIAAGAAGGSGVTGAAGLGGAPGARAGGTTGAGAAGGTGAGATGATKASGGSAGAGGAAGAGTPGGAGVGATGAGRGAVGAGGVGPNTGGAGAVPAGSGGAARPRPYFVLLLEQFLSLPPSTGPVSSLECPPPVQSQSHLQPASPLPAPSPYTGPTGGLTARREPESRLVSPVRAARTSRRGLRQRPPPAPGTHQMALRPSSAPQRVPLPSPPASSLPALADPPSDLARAASPTVTRLLATVVTDPSFQTTAASALSVCPPSVGGECALSKDVLEDKQEEFQCFAAALPHLVSMLLTLEGDPDALDIPTPRSYAEAIEGPYSSQWQTAMDAEMASWKSTSTYVDEVPPPGVNIVDGMWIFRVKRSPGSPPVFKARYVARGFSQWQGVDYFQTFSPTPKMTTLWVLLHVAAQRDYELHSLDFSTAFLQGSLHEEIWLRRPPGFIGTTLAALGFAPSTVYPSLFLRTDTTLPSFYILVYVDDLVFASADTAGLTLVKSELQKRHTCTDLGELRSYLGLQITQDRARHTITLTQSHMVRQVLQRFNFTYSSPQATPLSTRHSLSALPSDESVEPSGPYLELVGCLIPGGKASRARAGGAGVGGPCTRRREPLSSQQLRKRAVRWGSPAGGAWCATTGGPYESTPAGSAAGESTPAGSATGRHGGSGGGQQRQQRPPETLSPQQLPEWAVRWGSPGSGAWGTSAGGGEAPGCVDAASLGAFDSSAIGAEP
ncbi:unnamed protein product [Closterium sp. NIES-54]